MEVTVETGCKQLVQPLDRCAHCVTDRLKRVPFKVKNVAAQDNYLYHIRGLCDLAHAPFGVRSPRK